MKFHVSREDEGFRVDFYEGDTVHTRFPRDVSELDVAVLHEFGCTPEDQVMADRRKELDVMPMDFPNKAYFDWLNYRGIEP